MNSCLYECRVMHRRFAPKVHGFDYRIFLFALDLDELDALSRRLRLFSCERRNLYRFRDRDYLPAGEPVHNASAPVPARPAPGAPLKQRVAAHLAARGIELGDGRVLLVTLPRVLGYLFNPVSFYFCFDRTGAPLAAVAEVTNTFREMKPFLLGPETRRTGEGGMAFHLQIPKNFYVSPFSATDVAFAFTLRPPAARLAVQIDDFEGDVRNLTSTLTGSRQPLSDARLAWFTLKYPFVTLKIIALIHWHALQLWWKNVPWFAKAARPEAQRDLYRPHPSIAPAVKP